MQQCETAKVLKTSQYCENALKSRVDDGVGYSVGHWVINGVVGHGGCRGFGHGVGYAVETVIVYYMGSVYSEVALCE